MDGPIKIGCSQQPQGRASNLETWSPFALEVVAEIDAGHGFQLEHRFHAAFEHLHQRREWFHPGPDLLTVIAAIRAGTFDVGSLPDPKRIDNPRRKAVRAPLKYNPAARPDATVYPLLREIDAFTRAHGLSPSKFGMDAVGDPKLVGELSVGREPRMSTIAKLRTYMASFAQAAAA
jgi:hypothetical protein